MVYFDTVKLLEEHNHSSVFFSMQHPENLPCLTSEYFVSYADLNASKGPVDKIKIAARILYSLESKKRIESLIKNERPDIAHLHNIHHQISPSILHSFKKFNIPVVMTLHDYKMSCPAYSMLDDGKVCEACKGAKYYCCFLKTCVKNSKAKSLLNTIEMYLHHKILHIYDLVDVFISPSEFLKNKLEEMGFRGNIRHVSNFVNLDDFPPRYNCEENSFVYFGRLSKEKGLFILIEAVKNLDIKLKIIGEGPIEESLKSEVRTQKSDNIDFLGYKSGEELKNEIRKSMFVVLPSECYENNPRSIIEAFALGKPVIGSRIGGIPELVRDYVTGLLFEPGNPDDLRRCISYLKSNPDKIVEMGKNGRNLIEKEYNPDAYYQKLIALYDSIAR